jgi:hypothetical protein
LGVFRTIFLIAIYFFITAEAWGQSPADGSNNLRHKKIAVIPGMVARLDTLSIIPSSFRIEGVDSLQYALDYINAALYWKLPPKDSVVWVTYRVFPFKLNGTLQRMNFDSLVLFSAAPIRAPYNKADRQKELFNFGTINAQGSFGRQVGFGNNQDVVLNSNLNIQLSGMLADSIELQAAITDNNVPIQPDGNTQQLNEFDEVYIRFKKKNWQLNIGDMDLREDRSYFLKFYKRLQGISFQTVNNISKRTQSNTLVSGSIAKGKFTRNVLQGLEGNQGPYRLSGANGETFFIILANTERVFIDGELLQRGEDQDYVINYNTAEITFTPRRMITKDSRIQVEFEYADRNFLNTNVYAMQEVNFNNKVKLKVGYFNNSDAKNSSINQVLDARQKQLLFNIGDSVQNAYAPSVMMDTLTAGKILYERVYDTVDNVIDSFYRYSTNPETARYNLAFTDVGFGRGNYITDNGNANGKVFVYIAPVNGIRQGNYDPVILLVAPRKQQVLTLGVDYNIAANTVLKTELATSKYDVNTLSSLHDNDDNGYAAKINISNAQLLREKNKLSLVSSLDYEYVQQRFQPLERLRDVEFTRDWGLPLVAQRATENIIKASTGLRADNGNAVQYTFTNYNRSDDYNGFQNALTQFTSWKNWVFNNQFVLTNYRTNTYEGHFLKPIIDISKKLSWMDNWIIGGRYTLEENLNRNTLNDSLNFTSFSFDTYTAYLKSSPEKRNRYGINFYTRSDKYPVGKELIRGDRSYNLNLQAELLANTKRQFYLNTTFRKLKVYNDEVSAQTEDNTVLARAEYQMNEWNGFLNGNVLYEVGSGQEQKRDYAYLEVPPGTGQYTWIDYNEDGVQQLNEFELAAFADQAKFIRIFTPTNEYIKANYTTLNYSINVTPRLLWGNQAKGFTGFLSRWMLTSSLQVAKKSMADGIFEFNPFGYGLADSNLITLATILANTLSFNRQSTKWGIDVSNLRNNNKAFLTYGYETRKNNEWLLKYRHFLSGTITLNINALTGVNALYTDDVLFDNRNYEINRNNGELLLSYIKGTSFRITTGYKREHKKNAGIYGGETSLSNALTAETKYNILQSASVTGKFTYNGLKYSAGTNNAQTTVGYIMLDGLMPGTNLLWNLQLTKRLLNNLELNFQYDGRKPGNTRTIHTGRASVTAIF